MNPAPTPQMKRSSASFRFRVEFRAPDCPDQALPESPFRPLARQAAKPLASSAGSAIGSWRFLFGSHLRLGYHTTHPE